MDMYAQAYRTVTEKCGFDIKAGRKIDLSKNLDDIIDYVVKYIDEGNKGCCFHASIYLMKVLHDLGIESEIILTIEPAILENGDVSNNNRASVLTKKNDKYIVMNPIEDIEFFEKENIAGEARKDFYDGEGTTLKGKKEGINSPNAAEIDLEDFIARYGDGRAWTLGDFYCDNSKNINFLSVMSDAKFMDVEDYKLTSRELT